MAEAGVTASLGIHLLGCFVVSVDGVLVNEARWQRPRAKTLLKLLALRPDCQIHREQLADILWPDSDASGSANRINKLVYLARHALEPDLVSGGASRFLHRRTDLLLLRAPGGVHVDVHCFESDCARALSSGAVVDFENALAHYGGDLLGEDLYEDWVAPRREELRLLREDMLARLARIHEAGGRPHECIARWNELVVVDPANEEAHRQLMRLHANAGDRRRSLRQFEHCRDALRRELAVDPEPATVSLYEAITERDGPAAASVPRGPGPEIMPGPAPVVARGGLAVLPFTNTTGDPRLDYLCHGLAESLIHDLARLPGLRVLAYATVSRYAGTGPDPLLIGADLGVQAVVLGRVAQWSDQLVVAVELVDADDGSLLWGAHFNRAAGDVFAVHDEIAGHVSRQLRPRLTGIDRGRLGKRHTDSSDAYEHYLMGRYHWNKRTAGAIRQAMACFEAAIEVDPDYALAYAGLADCYNLASLYGVLQPKTALVRAEAAARRALELDATLAEAHTSLAYHRMCYQWNWQGAERELERAISLNAGYATARQWYHMCLTARGRFEEARTHIERARELDPLSLMVNTESGWGRYFARRYDEAEAQLRRALELDARFPLARLILGMVLLQAQRPDEAQVQVQQAIALTEGATFTLAHGVLGNVQARRGRDADARAQAAVLQQSAEDNPASAYALALVHAGLGECESAARALECAGDARYDRVIFAQVEPLFDGLRRDTRFRHLNQRIHPA